MDERPVKGDNEKEDLRNYGHHKKDETASTKNLDKPMFGFRDSEKAGFQKSSTCHKYLPMAASHAI